MPKPDTSLLTAALVGYQHELAEIDSKIAQIRKQLGGRTAFASNLRGGGEVPGPFPRAKRRPMSPAARKRIAAAQKKRWAAYRKGTKT